jgi:exopolysaccharide biosynthesis WecB/TagA/CpsF family protein
MISLLRQTKKIDLGKPGLFTFLNPYSYLIARNYRLIFARFNIFFDGIALVIFLRLFGISRLKRQSFDMTSLAKDVFRFAEQQGKSLFLIGTEESYIADAVRKIAQEYPSLIISGYRNGFFGNSEERADVIKSIHSISPDVVVAGMGTPTQEQFLFDIWQQGWRGIGFTCGGFFHQTAKGLEYYPRWMDRLHLRWLYRIYDEPKLLKRYLFQYPKFVWFFLVDYVQYRRNKGNF